MWEIKIIQSIENSQAGWELRAQKRITEMRDVLDLVEACGAKPLTVMYGLIGCFLTEHDNERT